MPVEALPRISYREKHSDLSRVTFMGRVVFDSRERDLELVLSHSMPDEDADPFENLVLPLTILLVESIGTDGNPAEKQGYEDLYSFTHDGFFMGHLHRRFIRDSIGRRHYEQANFNQDGDITKLYRYGEAIRDMIGEKRLEYPLENHPTVRKLRTHTLWQE
jgi:hypothetical protein